MSDDEQTRADMVCMSDEMPIHEWVRDDDGENVSLFRNGSRMLALPARFYDAETDKARAYGEALCEAIIQQEIRWMLGLDLPSAPTPPAPPDASPSPDAPVSAERS